MQFHDFSLSALTLMLTDNWVMGTEPQALLKKINTLHWSLLGNPHFLFTDVFSTQDNSNFSHLPFLTQTQIPNLTWTNDQRLDKVLQTLPTLKNASQPSSSGTLPGQSLSIPKSAATPGSLFQPKLYLLEEQPLNMAQALSSLIPTISLRDLPLSNIVPTNKEDKGFEIYLTVNSSCQSTLAFHPCANCSSSLCQPL